MRANLHKSAFNAVRLVRSSCKEPAYAGVSSFFSCVRKPILLFVSLTLLWITPVGLAQAETAGKKLIPVKPSYHEATYVPPAERPTVDPNMPPPPTPREQMYVFWILGKMLSYPIDKAESYVYSFTKKTKPKVDGAPTPATAAATPNPFSSVNWSEIPPSPPASGRSEKSR
jgi:hypothetical protein